MAQELFTNGAESTLSAGINDSTTSIGVADGSVFPATGNFRIRIDDEILLVTARSGNTLTATRGQEGTTAASHDSAAAVKQILTAASLRRATMEVGDGLTVSGDEGFAQGHTCEVQSAAQQATARGYQALARLSTAFVEASGLPAGWATGDAQRIRLSLTQATEASSSAALNFHGEGEGGTNDIDMPNNCTWLVHLMLLGVNSQGNIAAWDTVFIAQTNSAGTYTGVHHPGGASNIAPNFLSEFAATLTIAGVLSDGKISLTVTDAEGFAARWHGSLDITELIAPDTGYGYGY